MWLRFLDRTEELARLRALFARRHRSMAVVYGRRRCGKSRLLLEALPPGPAIYYAADERESTLQRTALAAEIARHLPDFDRVTYPEWDALLARLWAEAPSHTVLALDEFPALAATAPELPSLLQKYADRPAAGPHLVLAGSSQRMMQGLILDRSAPLFGRATEVLKIGPLSCGWIQEALEIPDPLAAIEAYAVWGGVPRYWELAADFPNLRSAYSALVLSPLGVLHDEPARLLLDDLRDTAQAASILSLIGQGCHRVSEIAGRLAKPSTSLSRPLGRLLDLGLVRRDLPFGASVRDSKRSLYRISDPFLRFWFRFVEPGRSRLESGQVDLVAREIDAGFSRHVSGVWEDLVRESVPRGRYFNRTWGPARSWWGPGRDRSPLEIDLIAESTDGKALLLGEAKWTVRTNLDGLASVLAQKADNLPLAEGRRLCLGLWTVADGGRPVGRSDRFGPAKVLEILK